MVRFTDFLRAAMNPGDELSFFPLACLFTALRFRCGHPGERKEFSTSDASRSSISHRFDVLGAFSKFTSLLKCTKFLVLRLMLSGSEATCFGGGGTFTGRK